MQSLFSISIISLICLFQLFLPLHAFDLKNNGSDFDSFQKTISHLEAQKKIATMLQRDKDIEDWYELSKERLKIYGSKEDKLKNLPEFILELGNSTKPRKEFPKLGNPLQPLKGLKIAIDPGHMGGDIAKLETKYVQMPANPAKGIAKEIYFSEGDLAVLTAKMLAQKLEALGAKVFLTKSSPGQGVYRKSFEDWMRDDFDSAIQKMIELRPFNVRQTEEAWWHQASPPEIFLLTYNYLDVERRAELINAFQPHLTVSCHYNLGGGYNKDGNTPGTDADYAFFYVPGAFEKGDQKHEAFAQKSLQDARSRYEFIRLITSDDIESSINLAKIAVKNTQKILKVPIAKHDFWGMPHAPGIYHRNLSLCKFVHSPILYGEPLLQDNYQNAQILESQPELLIQKLVNIYTRSILEWADQSSQQMFQDPSRASK